MSSDGSLMTSDGGLLLSRWGDLLSSKGLLNRGCPIGDVVSFLLYHAATEDDTAVRLPQLLQGLLAPALLLSTTAVDFVIGFLGLSTINRQLSFIQGRSFLFALTPTRATG